jgi:hypothetical protein
VHQDRHSLVAELWPSWASHVVPNKGARPPTGRSRRSPTRIRDLIAQVTGQPLQQIEA